MKAISISPYVCNDVHLLLFLWRDWLLALHTYLPDAWKPESATQLTCSQQEVEEWWAERYRVKALEEFAHNGHQYL